MRVRRAAIFILCAVIIIVIVLDVGPVRAVDGLPELLAEPWPEAEQLFRRDGFWLGGDGASTVALGAERILWLFGDSFIDPAGTGDRRAASIIRNSIAVQKGRDPAGATVSFFWRDDDGCPLPFFPGNGDRWYWPGAGVRLETGLLIFLMEIEEAQNELGFDAAGWKAVTVDNPDDEPPCWRLERISQLPGKDFGIIVGSGSAFVRDEHLYAVGADPERRNIYVLRWSLKDAGRADLSRPCWWSGESGRWVPVDRLSGVPSPLFTEGQMEFTLHYNESLGKYLHIQTGTFIDPAIMLRGARNITGPWSSPERVYEVPESREKGLFVYAGKAHPSLAGADLVITYNVNTMDRERLLSDRGIYFPRFVKVFLALCSGTK
ncbi:MAG: DUF4185 domain-containing protein [Deltaproteobacteria bacterium]|nr:DUF4185 domain-containing protein [Deltaproteobacteria bacterium]